MAGPLDDETGLRDLGCRELSGLHPQTLRQYERIGLVSPDRSGGRNRRYSMRDILHCARSRNWRRGLNLAGIQGSWRSRQRSGFA